MDQRRESEPDRRCRRLDAGSSNLHSSTDPFQQPVLHRGVTHRQIAAHAGANTLRDSGQEIFDATGAVHARGADIDPLARKEPVSERLIQRDHPIEIGGEATRDADSTLPRRVGAPFRLPRQSTIALAPRLLGHVTDNPTPWVPSTLPPGIQCWRQISRRSTPRVVSLYHRVMIEDASAELYLRKALESLAGA